jgi:hypothetical protein
MAPDDTILVTALLVFVRVYAPLPFKLRVAAVMEAVCETAELLTR